MNRQASDLEADIQQVPQDPNRKRLMHLKKELFDAEDENEVEDDQSVGPKPVEGTPVVIHEISHDDTLRSVAKKYGIKTDNLMLANGIQNLTPDCLEGRKYLVIPSTATFIGPMWDGDDERVELCRNLMLLLQEDYGNAYYYLERANYVLPDAIELYYYDLC